MCVIFFYANSNPEPNGYKLILASNRDEFFARETRNVAKWANAEHVYGGIDLEPGREGGTWLALGAQNRVFKVGALLNLTGEPKPRNAVAHNNILQMHNNSNSNWTSQNLSNINSISKSNLRPISTTTTNHTNFLLGRGMIVADYVSSAKPDFDNENYNKRLVADCTKYSAFNFVSIEIGDTSKPAAIKLLSNVPPTLVSYEQGKCYGFGNSLPEAPFEKVRYGTKRFTEIVKAYNANPTPKNSEQLLNDLNYMLKEKTKHWPDNELARRAPSWGEGLSSLNVHIPEHEYGSRTHTVILVDSQNKLDFYEETMCGLDPSGKWESTHIEKTFAF